MATHKRRTRSFPDPWKKKRPGEASGRASLCDSTRKEAAWSNELCSPADACRAATGAAQPPGPEWDALCYDHCAKKKKERGTKRRASLQREREKEKKC